MAKILLLEDEERFAKQFAGGLRVMGHDVVLASNGRYALDLCRQHKPDIVITDIFMPEKDGLEVIPQVRKVAPGAKIIAISGALPTHSKTMLDLAQTLGADRTLAKPFSLDEICMEVTALGYPPCAQ